MAEDHELPVWGVRPNWEQAIIETLEWKSDVLTSGTGAEQRIAYRLAPRRLVEAHYNPFENERTFTDLAMHRLGRSEWMVPLWFDSVKLTSGSAAGTSRLNFPTAYHEFAAGGMAYLVGPDCFTGEAVRIDAVDANGIDLTVPLNAAWSAGTTIHPMRRARFETPTQALLTSRVSDLSLRCEIIEGNDLSDEGAWDTLHLGFPVLTHSSNWSEQIDIDLSWLSDEFDSETGLRYVTDDAGRAFRQQRHSFLLVGAQEQFEYRQMLYRLRGRQKPIWVPSSTDDLTVAVAAEAGATEIDVEQVGLAYVGGPIDGRDHVRLPSGTIVQISDALVVPNGRERLTLASATMGALAAGDRLSFIETCHLAQDSVEIEHLGDTDGAARSTLSFAAFADRRTATTAVVGIPAAAKSNEQCGTPEEGTCAIWTPPPEFEGIYVYLMLEVSPVPAGSLLYYPKTPDWALANTTEGVSGSTNDSPTDPLWFETIPAPANAGYEFAGFFGYMTVDIGEPLFNDDWKLTLQFPSGGVWENSEERVNWCRLSYRHWTQPDWTVVVPHSTNSGLEIFENGWFEVRGLWPDDWFFTF